MKTRSGRTYGSYANRFAPYARTAKKLYQGFKTARSVYRGIKRRYPGPYRRSAPKRARTRQNDTGGSQWTKSRKVTGRYLSAARYDHQFVKSISRPLIYKYQGIKEFDDNGFFVGSFDSVTENANFNYMPVYAVSLNSVNQRGINPCPMKRLACHNVAATGLSTNGGLFWSDWAGINAVGGPTGIYNAEVQPQGGASTGSDDVGASTMWKWTQVKMNLWGAKAKAITWNVQVVKFVDEDMDPFFVSPDPAAINQMIPRGQQSWAPLLKQIVWNPIDAIGSAQRKGMRVLKSFTKTIQPTTNIENDTDPQVHTLKWFMKQDKRCNYDSLASSNGSVGVYQPVGTNADWDTDGVTNGDLEHQVSALPRFSEHVVLLISCNAYDRQAFSNNVHGSFDMVVRNKHNVVTTVN